MTDEPGHFCARLARQDHSPTSEMIASIGRSLIADFNSPSGSPTPHATYFRLFVYFSQFAQMFPAEHPMEE